MSPPVERLAERRERLLSALSSRGLDALLVTHLPNVVYLTGLFASSAVALVTRDTTILLSDARYAEALDERGRECPFITPRTLGPGLGYEQGLAEILKGHAGACVGFEAAHLTVKQHRDLLNALGEEWETALVATENLVEPLRAVKDEWEIGRLREGAGRLSEVAACILPKVVAGRTEVEVAAEIDAALRARGFERPAFDTIVAAGPHAARPHARPGERRLERGDLVVLDFGGVFDGYCTDLTRTVVIGGADARQRRLVEQVIEAQAAAFAAVRAGGAPEAVDAAARAVLERHGLGEAFTHGAGHGLGLEIHEAPRVGRSRPGHPEPPLAGGMVLTLEPGVYFPGEGGVRIEDDVLVTDTGAEWLTDVVREPA